MSSYSTYPYGDVHYKSPVASVAALPASGNTIGDARVAEDTYGVYVWNGSSWVAPATGSGTVTSVALSLPAIFSVSGSPVTTSGTLSASLANETANFVFSGPTSGGAASPTFRALVAADIPNLSASKITSGQGSASTSTTGVTVVGTNATLTSVTVDVQTASGSQPGLLSAADWTTFNSKLSSAVTSVALSFPAGVLYTVTGSPVTTTGTLTANLNTQVANTVLSGPTTGADATPTFRALVSNDIPNLSAAKITSGQGTLSTSTTGVTVGTGTNSTLVNATINVQTATGAQPGLISAADWTTFNAKQSALTIGNLTAAGTDGVSVTNGTGSVIGSGTSIAQQAADATHNGYLTSTSFNKFNAAATAKILYVSQDIGNDSNAGTQTKPYLTIQAAITAAEATAAFYNQIIIRVTPGSSSAGYSENLTFSQQGVVLEGSPVTNRSDAVLIKGNIVINLSGTSGGGNYQAASNIIYIKGCILTCSSGNTLTFSGTTFQRLFVADSYFDNSGTGSAIVLTNTGSSGGTLSTITSKNCDINNNNATNPVIKLSAGRIFVSGPTYDITNANASGPSVLVDGASAAGCTLSLDKASITGQVQVTDNTSVAYLTFCSISSGSAAAIVTPASPNTGFILCGSVSLTTTATNSVTGSGIVVLSGMAKASSGGDIISTVTQSCLNAFPQGQTQFGAGATSVTNALVIVKNGHITSQQTTAPTSALQTGAGTTASRTLTRCTDTAGNISITTQGTGIAAGAQLIVTFNKAYATAPVVTLTPTNANAGTTGVTGIGPYVTSSTTTFTINFAVAGVTATAYTFTYQVIET